MSGVNCASRKFRRAVRQIVIGIGEVRVIENIEELASQLQAEALSEFEVLDD